MKTDMIIRSGGQTGADRAALDFAIRHGMRYCGWCPVGGWAEDMPEPPGLLQDYPLLKEAPSPEPALRTEWNARDGDVTLILLQTNELQNSRGTILTEEMAVKYGKPCMIVDMSTETAAESVRRWLA